MFIVGVRIIKQGFQFLYYTFKGNIYSVLFEVLVYNHTCMNCTQGRKIGYD